MGRTGGVAAAIAKAVRSGRFRVCLQNIHRGRREAKNNQLRTHVENQRLPWQPQSVILRFQSQNAVELLSISTSLKMREDGE